MKSTPTNTKNRTNGNKTRSHDISAYPALHIRLRTQVQNTIYNSCPMNTATVLKTCEYSPYNIYQHFLIFEFQLLHNKHRQNEYRYASP